jgi:epoxyqueuosine reductase
MELLSQLEKIAREWGADYFGAADITPATDFIRKQGGDLPASYPSAVCVGKTLPPDLFEPLVAEEKEAGALITYNHYVYKVCNPMLDRLTLILASELSRQGYRAMPVAASLYVPGKYFAGTVSQKIAPHLAGLGWIGKNGLVVTPEDGPRVRWGTVLTDILVKAAKPLERRCGKCTRCVDACPPKALTGKDFGPEGPREIYIDPKKCDDYRNVINQDHGSRTCGKCIAACPFANKK